MGLSPYSILVLGATYGSLIASKLLLAGHNVDIVALPQEREAIDRDGLRVRFPVDQGTGTVELNSRVLPGRLRTAAPPQVDPSRFDIAILGMQEPQYRFPEVRDLMSSIGSARVPCLSIMNMPPLSFLARLHGVDLESVRASYVNPEIWDRLDPALVTHCSADPQAARPADAPPNVLEVRLPSNFKAARFADAAHNAILEKLASDIDASAFRDGSQCHQLPVRLKVHPSIHIAISKWPMLITGNYRCMTPDGPRSIAAAVHSDLEESRTIYEWALELCRRLGADRRVLIPFRMYAAAARSLTAPSSAARALAGGAEHIERVDRLVHRLAARNDMKSAHLDAIVQLVDDTLSLNRRA